MNKYFPVLVIVSMLCFASGMFAQTSPAHPSKHELKHWFHKKNWLNGLQWQPHSSVNKEEFKRQYTLHKEYWDKAFLFLKEQDLQQLAVGKYPIDGENVYALITHNATRDIDSAKWESHRNYIDLQSVISGEEKIGVSPDSDLTVSMPYDGTKDLMNYTGDGKFYHAKPGTFFLFFPHDAHKPNVTTGGNEPDKKIVIKIRYAP